jgi:hypothetical protein
MKPKSDKTMPPDQDLKRIADAFGKFAELIDKSLASSVTRLRNMQEENRQHVETNRKRIAGAGRG